MDIYHNSADTKKLLGDLEQNQGLRHSSTSHFKKLKNLIEAIENKNIGEITKIYYQSQHRHTLNNDPPFKVPVYINDNVDENWKPHIDNAIECINLAAPGLYLFKTEQKDEKKIDIAGSENGAWTQLKSDHALINLGKDWEKYQLEGTCLHELLHALGFEHEMQRSDADLYVVRPKPEDKYEQYYSTNCQSQSLTRFDPFSVLMYPEDENMKRKEGDPIWKMKSGTERSQKLSELNKVALNLLYKPCRSSNYSPKLSENGMLYCNRKVMATHNQNVPKSTNGTCGPDNWANCPACRVIIKCLDDESKTVKTIDKIEECIKEGKWQGLSGLFYCGTRYSEAFSTIMEGEVIQSDGVCGSNNGQPCNNCGQILDPSYELKLPK